MDSVIIKKSTTIERCISRILTEYNVAKEGLKEDFTRQDAIILNIQRAVQATLDLGMHLIKSKKWGIPEESRHIFEILEKQGVISSELSDHLKKMVGFRNLAVHDYQNLDIDVIKYVIEERLSDLLTFSKNCIQTQSH